MKLAVIGGYGLLGSTAAFCAGQKGLFDDIYLIGRKKNLLKSHVMDMDQALRAVSRTKVREGEYACLHECDVILFTASMPEREVDNRNEYLSANRELVENIACQIKANCSEKVILCATNPIDVFNYALYRILGWDRNKFLGFGYNDTLRLKWALADELGLEYQGLEAYVLGEHGDLQAPVFSQIRYRGEKIELDGEKAKRVGGMIANYFRSFQALDAKRTSGWTSAIGIATILEAIVEEREEYFPCSAVLQGEYGLHDISAGVPVRLGRNGIRSILALNLIEEEQQRLDMAGEGIRRQIKTVGY
ncbi:hypothetical protein LJC27_02070 [Christensenellaceae bacterium OttesenSCG-928-M15]|nr:hypothetical protein [Christensenellaceae bacterium OttesenSCG-928-M15]